MIIDTLRQIARQQTDSGIKISLMNLILNVLLPTMKIINPEKSGFDKIEDLVNKFMDAKNLQKINSKAVSRLPWYTYQFSSAKTKKLEYHQAAQYYYASILLISSLSDQLP